MVQGLPPYQGFQYNPVITTPGTYSVGVGYIDDVGCTAYSVMPNQLVVYPRPKADFIADPGFELTVANGDVLLQNNSSPISGNTYTWNVANMYSTTDVNTSTTFTMAGTYPVTLWATNIYGCKDSVTKTINVKNEYGFYVPNAFTPFNDDGLNEEFKPVYSPYGIDLEGGYEMLIFDRWGHLIFKTNDIDKGWDGTKNGTKLPQDVYVYKIRYRDALKNSHQVVGHVTLLH
jgi:gliding motility-associated-like protein